MRGLGIPRSRRLRPGAAAAAYSLALSIIGYPPDAEIVAARALKRGSHSRLGVLAHARNQALERAENNPSPAVDIPVKEDARLIALQLATTRPPLERAIVNLELRYGLDTSSFARVLGISNLRAADKAKSVATTWAEVLDPAMMTWLGPGSCSQLETILIQKNLWPHAPSSQTFSETPSLPNLLPTGTDPTPLGKMSDLDTQQDPIQIRDLLEAASDVLTHTVSCEVCAERLRLMTSVRTLIGQQPTETVPPLVAAAAKSARRRLPGPPPPSIEPRRIDGLKVRFLIGTALTVGVLLASGFAVFTVANHDSQHETQAERVKRLVNAIPSSRLLATPTVITSEVKTAALANNGTEPILWHATTSAAWLNVQPSSGRLTPTQSVSLLIQTTSVPTNDITDAIVTITGSDGSTQTLRYDVKK